MNSSLLKKIFCLTLMIVSMSNFAQNSILSKNARVSIITCDTGNESYSLFGHTAIRITDIENNLDLVYNYGAFDFSTPNFVAKFAKGDLQYFAVVNVFSDFMNQYTYEHRSVYEQELIVPLVYKQKLLDNLSTTLASSESYYTYKFIDKNCTSMVVEILNKTLGAKTIVKKTDTDKTYRSILYPYFDNSFYEKLGTSIIFGKKVDEYGTKIFLPLELHKSLKLISFENHPLCKESKTLLEFKKAAPNCWWDTIYTFVIFLGLILILNKKSIDLFYILTMGLLGIFFGFMGFYSFHEELAYNYNMMLFNPALLVLFYFILRKNRKWIINLCVFNVISMGVYLILMFNKAHLLIMLPLIITSLAVLIKIAVKNSKRIPIVF
ncbi:lipoprotein N-acyltransferase Lnb domain-containing protein [Flavobacterium soyangense]|uniref:DUF4105 domain-containing protein n=1 Tax=Flavobacterium soyangense TaxID=2023265 RepID=A0A930UA56_9FLAO|nr:DUF4105 domain-containing protein [Flavobacterium soyangense]MBF2708305.1 DUF4105 domain-containing protein [Flavobacterium soyangense]